MASSRCLDQVAAPSRRRTGSHTQLTEFLSPAPGALARAFLNQPACGGFGPWKPTPLMAPKAEPSETWDQAAAPLEPAVWPCPGTPGWTELKHSEIWE